MPVGEGEGIVKRYIYIYIYIYISVGGYHWVSEGSRCGEGKIAHVFLSANQLLKEKLDERERESVSKEVWLSMCGKKEARD